MTDSQSSRLRELLEQLHAELEHTTGVDAESRQILEHLRQDIQVVLSASDAASHYPSLGSRMNTTITHLEESHPQLTLLIKQLLDHLAAV
ncbi:MAG: DUF4404 family protein [Chloroflexi bacterium]|nr:DUF4404 family protein [Chloroflexota bacterium]